MYYSNRKPSLGAKPDPLWIQISGCVGLWLLNEGGGNKAYDLSGNRNGTLTNMAFPPTATSGRVGSDIAFDGVNDTVITPTISHNVGTGDFTWIVKAKPRSVDAAKWRCLCSNGNYVPGLYSSVNLSLAFVFYFGGTYYSGHPTVLNTWQTYVVVRKNSVISFYVNGIKTTNSYTVATSIANEQFMIGKDTSATSAFDGLIEFVLFFNRALSAPEIRRLYAEPYYMFPTSQLITAQPKIPIEYYRGVI